MRITELIERLEQIKDEEGDLIVCTSEPHEYWGTLHQELDKYNVCVNPNAQPKGPKSGETERAVVFTTY